MVIHSYFDPNTAELKKMWPISIRLIQELVLILIFSIYKSSIFGVILITFIWWIHWNSAQGILCGFLQPCPITQNKNFGLLKYPVAYSVFKTNQQIRYMHGRPIWIQSSSSWRTVTISIFRFLVDTESIIAFDKH